MVHEGQRMVSRQRAQPQRDLGEVHRHRVPVDSVQALPGDEAAGMDHLVLVGRNVRHLAVGAPRVDERVGKLAAGLDQEGPGAHGRVADLDVEDPRRGRRPAVLAAEPFEDGGQGMAHDGLGQLAGGVVGARSAALLVRLQHQGAGRNEVRGGVLVQHAVERRVQVFHRPGGAESLRDGVRQVPVRARLQPLRSAARPLRQQRVEIDRARSAELLRGLDGDGSARRDLHPKAHDGLVHRADLLHVEGAVGDAFAVEDEQLLQHPVHGAVGDERRPDALEPLPGARARTGPAPFEEREAVRVEQCAPALRQADRAAGAVVARSVVDEAKQHEQLRPGAEALVHGVRVEGCVFAQALVEAGERVVPDEGLVLRQHAALLGVEEEDEAQDHGEQSAVDVVAIAFGRERLAQQRCAGSVMGGLEPAQKLVERVHHLLGEALAHLVLVLAAVFQERGEPLAAGQCEEALLGEQHAECGAERAPGGPAHVRDAEVHPARAFAARGGDEAKRGAVEQQAGGNPGAAKETLGAPLGRGFQARAGTAAGRRNVEVPARVEHLHE